MSTVAGQGVVDAHWKAKIGAKIGGKHQAERFGMSRQISARLPAWGDTTASYHSKPAKDPPTRGISMIELTRVPSRQYQQAQHRRDDLGWAVHLESFRKYDYTTPDGRWRVQQNRGCGGGWSIIDTKHEYICGSCA